jgi:hypothetical protein
MTKTAPHPLWNGFCWRVPLRGFEHHYQLGNYLILLMTTIIQIIARYVARKAALFVRSGKRICAMPV